MSATTSAESPASRVVIAVLSTVLILAVFFVVYGLPERSGVEASVGILPSVNATLNGAASIFLALGYVFVRKRKLAEHKACMLTACGVSAAFLVTYLMHHARAGSVPFTGTGPIRTVYFAILIPHIVLAAVIVPLALLTVYRGWTGRYELHRRVARWTFPLWMFVSISGVVVYFMLYHLTG